MSTLTKEWLLKTIAEIEEERDAVPGAVNEDASMALAAMKLALASLEAEPVGYFGRFDADDEDLIDQCSHNISGAFPLYTAPPAPVSVPDELTREEYKRRFMEEDNFDDTFRGGWNACRAATLQGADGNSPVIPGGWVACSERMPETMVSVLVTGTWFHHAVAFWDGLSWCDIDFEQPVTHWMPLPAAPQ